MDSATWDFDAPEFVDFNADEHALGVGRESYFDYDHEQLRKEGMTVEEFKKTQLLNPAVPGTPNARLTFDTPKRIDTRSVTASDADKELTSPMAMTSATTSEQPNTMSAMTPEQPTTMSTMTTQQQPISKIKPDISQEIPDSGIDSMTLQEDDEKPTCSEATIDTKVETVAGGKAPDKTNVFEIKKDTSYLPNLMTPSRFASWGKPKNRRSADQASQKRRSGRLMQAKKEIRRTRALEQASATTKLGEPVAKKKRSNVQLAGAGTPVQWHQRHGSVPKAKSTAELELEEIERAKREQKKRLEENSNSLKAALRGPPPRPPTPSKITKAKEFKFKTDERLKSTHAMQTRSTKLSSEIDFAKELRKHTPTSGKLKTTEVKPFNFSSNRKRKILNFDKDEKPYPFNHGSKPILDFHKKPDRSGRKDFVCDEDSCIGIIHKGPMKAGPMLTNAQTPKLIARTRSRPVKILSAQEKEQLELEELRNHQFKAKPANRKILEHPDELPVVPKHENTKAEEFHLHIKKKVEIKPEQPISREFKARPVPKSLYEGPSHIEREKLMTVPQSPAFQLKNRMQMAQIRRENKAIEEKENTKPQPAPKAPDHKPTKKVEVHEKRVIEPQPFSFEERDKEMLAKKEAKIREVNEANRLQASAFRAQPMVFQSDPAGALPVKVKKPATKAKPFRLISDVRGNEKVEKWKAQLEKETEEIKAMTEFKANRNYAKLLHKPGFQPTHAEKKDFNFEEFSLHTNARAVERQGFEEWQKRKEETILRQAEETKRINALKEQEEIRQLRRSAEPKAAPIRKYKDLVITESDRQPTVPESPNFSDRFYKKVPSTNM